jgi:signal transduction histidine kinase
LISTEEKVRLTVSVTDQGLGISKEDQLNLSKPILGTADEESRKLNSVSHGIGLSFRVWEETWYIIHCILLDASLF